VAFRGTFDHSLDAKNRLTVPSRHRAALADGVILAQGLSPCATIWTPAAFEAYTASALEGWPALSPEAEKLNRFFSSYSLDTELDAAGRVMFPPWLMQYAGLGKEVVISGMGNRLEVWDRGTWAQQTESLPDDVRQITATLGHAR
jgi:MraZ protein